MFHHIQVQLLGTLAVESESSNFHFNFTARRAISVILRCTRTEFNDVISFEFVLEFTKVLAQRRLIDRGVVLSEDDRIRVEVHYTLIETLQFLVQFKSSVTCRKTGHEDFEVRCDVDHVVVDLVAQFHTFFCQGA